MIVVVASWSESLPKGYSSKECLGIGGEILPIMDTAGFAIL
jgi:hypothetical protein